MGPCRKLPAVQTTALKRTTAHEANGAGVVGIKLCGVNIPLAFPISSCGIKKYVFIADGSRPYKKLKYRDLGVGKECCRKVLRFNIDHYYKCYLPSTLGINGSVTEPYEYNHCRKCNIALKDDCGHLIAWTNTREWRRDRYIYAPEEFLQDCKKEENCNV